MAYAVFRNARKDYEKCRRRDERMKLFVKYAALAPSPLNSQPWTFQIRGDALELRVDRSRVVPAYDLDNRLLYVSAGVLLRYLEEILNTTGFSFHVRLFPNFSDWDLIASVHLWTSPLDAKDSSPERRPNGNGSIHANGHLKVDLHKVVGDVADSENVRIHEVVSQQDIETLFETIQAAHTHEISDPEAPQLSVEEIQIPHLNQVELGRAVARGHPDLFIDPMLLGGVPSSPGGYLLISSFADNTVSRVMAGRALGSLQLVYQPEGYTLFANNLHFENEPFSSTLRQLFVSDRYPQVLASIRKTNETKPLPRRAVADMLR